LYLVPLALSVEAEQFGAAKKAIHRDRLIWLTRSYHIRQKQLSSGAPVFLAFFLSQVAIMAARHRNAHAAPAVVVAAAAAVAEATPPSALLTSTS
jgi:hypothetical protein